MVSETEPHHGTIGGYTNHGCRCWECTEANKLYMRQKRAELKVRRRMGRMPESSHGKTGYKNWGCKCETCRSAVGLKAA